MVPGSDDLARLAVSPIRMAESEQTIRRMPMKFEFAFADGNESIAGIRDFNRRTSPAGHQS
jgi:hypothetical protein